MKVLHIGLADHFTEKMLYQDNYLVMLNAKDGHSVTYIGDIYKFENGKLVETEECDRIIDYEVRLIRLQYDWIVNSFISKKIQKVKKLKYYLEDIKPDAILYHGCCGYELIDVAEYAKNNNVLFYIDTHSKFDNTAKTFISRLAYKHIQGYFVRDAIKIAKKVLYIGFQEKYFAKRMYNIPEEKLEYFPLGGIILDDNKQKEYRDELIKEMTFPNNAIICAHSGKIDQYKKTEQVIQAFINTKDDRLRLLIYGTIKDELRSNINRLIEMDKRISFLGWQDANGQEKILGATDLYIQPGGASATAQVALCAGCALVANRIDYKESMGDSIFYAENKDEVENTLKSIVNDIDVLYRMKEKGYSYAKEVLDYRKLANRYLR